MEISSLDHSEREDSILSMFESIKANPLVNDEEAADFFAGYSGYVDVYIRLGYLRILQKLAEDSSPFLQKFVNPENTVTALMAIHNFIK